ncbi:DUF1311 domain-containing protein [Desulfobulbus sp. F1]|nr:DUF1311 domain-containing protein [Desulfobulbus sp. F1]
MDKARTQGDLNDCAGMEFKEVDKKLNALYQEILTEYADDQKFIEKLKTAQRAWLLFRDAEMEALYPCQKENHCYYGSMFPMCYSLRLASLTVDRIEQLEKWTETEESENCRGSIKVR